MSSMRTTGGVGDARTRVRSGTVMVVKLVLFRSAESIAV